MEDGPTLQYKAELFPYEDYGYCLLKAVEKSDYPDSIIMRATMETDKIHLIGIEDRVEYKIALDYIKVRLHLKHSYILDDKGLYNNLTSVALPNKQYKTTDLDEGMSTISEDMDGWWKQRYLINHKTRQAWEFINDKQELNTVTKDDIDWESLKGLPTDAVRQAESLSARFPTFIRGYRNGVAEVSWQINPDGRYYMDEDGYGMTDDEEITLYGLIDRQGKIVKKFSRF